jgi:hypothetical protein
MQPWSSMTHRFLSPLDTEKHALTLRMLSNDAGVVRLPSICCSTFDCDVSGIYHHTFEKAQIGSIKPIVYEGFTKILKLYGLNVLKNSSKFRHFVYYCLTFLWKFEEGSSAQSALVSEALFSKIPIRFRYVVVLESRTYPIL